MIISEFTRIADEVYYEFAQSQHSHVLTHPTCEICKQRPSVRITRWGTIKAACLECLGEELEAFNEYCAEEERLQKAYEEG